MRQLYPKQTQHAAILTRALDTHRVALDASSTGTGKTLVASEIAAYYKRPTLVVCLKNSIPMWEEEMQDRGWPAIKVINYEMLRTGKTEWGQWNKQKLFDFKLPANALIIFDEAQKAQGIDTKNSKMLIGAKPFINLLLSATAVENPSEMRALGYLLGLHSLRDFWAWCRKNGCKPNQWGGLDFHDPSGKVLNALHHQIFPEYGSRLTVADLKDHFQETQIITTPLEFGEEIKKVYAEMEAELAVLVDASKSDSKHPAAERLVARLRGRQKAELCKVPVMIEMAEDLIKEGRSVVLFVNFNATIEALKARLKDAKVIRGERTEDEDRQEVMKAFQEDRCRLLICNTQAGGVSISLHDVTGKHPRTAIISPSDNAKDILQVMGRVHRAGGKTNSQQHVLFAAHTIETEVEKNCRKKMENVSIFNEGKESIDLTTELSETEKQVGDTEQHARYNPSSLGMWERCAGYESRQGTNARAEAGTRIHKALEKDTIEKLPEAERAVAATCRDYIDGLIQEKLPALPDFDYREIRLTIDLGDDIKTFGTCDRLIVYGNHGEMLDYKSGYRFVADAETNAQGWAYVIGAFQRLKQLETITFTFLIPNRDEVSTHTFHRSDLPEMALRLNTIIRRAMEVSEKLAAGFPDAETLLNPQPELCQYCARQAHCPALAAKALKIAQTLGKGLPVPENLVVSKDRPEDVPHLLRLAPIMEEWAKQVKEDALKVNLEEGIEFKGFVRQERSTPRKITSAIGAWDVVKEKGVGIEDFLLACGKVSITELEDAVAQAAPFKMKGKARAALTKELRANDLLKDEGKYWYLREDKL